VNTKNEPGQRIYGALIRLNGAGKLPSLAANPLPDGGASASLGSQLPFEPVGSHR